MWFWWFLFVSNLLIPVCMITGGKKDVETLSEGDQHDVGIQDKKVHEESGHLKVCSRSLRTALVEDRMGHVFGIPILISWISGKIWHLSSRVSIQKADSPESFG